MTSLGQSTFCDSVKCSSMECTTIDNSAGEMRIEHHTTTPADFSVHPGRPGQLYISTAAVATGGIWICTAGTGYSSGNAWRKIGTTA